MNLKQITLLLASLGLLLGLDSCHLLKGGGGTDELETVRTNKDTAKTIVDNGYKPEITNRDSLRNIKPDTIVWQDTLQESQFKQIIVEYKKIGQQPIIKDTLGWIDYAGKIYEGDLNQMRQAEMKEQYTLTIMLPFLANKYYKNEIPLRSLRAVEYYEGVELALDSLQKTKLALKVQVFDTEASGSKIDSLLKSKALAESDVILGPVSSKLLQKTANFGRDSGIMVVSPFNNNPSVTENNIFYLQLNPGYPVHYQHMGAFLAQGIETPAELKYRLKKQNLLIVGQERDSNAVRELLAAYQKGKNDLDAQIPSYLSPNNGLSIANIKKHLSQDALNIVIIPAHRSESFVFAALRELHSLVDRVEKGKGYEFLVIGMPQWKYYERINYDYYENLRLHFSDALFVQEDSREAKAFIKKYKQRYGIAPREFAYMGYDATLYLGKMLEKYGTGFPEHFHEAPYLGLQTRFYIEEVIEERPLLEDEEIIEKPLINRFENQFVHFLQFKDYQLRPLSIFISKLQEEIEAQQKED